MSDPFILLPEGGRTSVGADGEYGSNESSQYITFLPFDRNARSRDRQPRDREVRDSRGPAPSISGTASGALYVSTGELDEFGNLILAPTYEPIQRVVFYDLNPGWNTRAYIQEPITNSCYFSYMANGAVGSVAGLTSTLGVSGGYQDIVIGWMVINGVASVVSNGEIIYTVPSATTYPDPGKFNADVDALTIKKVLGKVEMYLVGDGQDGETKISELEIFDPVTYVSAALYLGGDVLHSEILEYPDVISGSFPATSGRIYENGVDSVIESSIPAITAYLYESEHIEIIGDIPAFTGFIGEFDSSVMSGSIPAATGQMFAFSDDTESVDFTIIFADIPPAYGVMSAIDNELASLDGDIPAAKFFASEGDLSIIDASIPAAKGAMYEHLTPANQLRLVSYVYTRNYYGDRPVEYLVFNSNMEIVGAFSMEQIDSMEINSLVSADGDATLTDIIYQAMISTMSASDVAALDGEGISVWALHLDSSGSTRYENFGFDSFMQIDGRDYGVNADGIHLLSGSTDNGTAISQSVDFGNLNFGTSSRKAIPYVYVGIAASGKPILKVESEGSTYYYTARNSTEGMQQHRFELGRGLRSSFYNMTLVSEGESFDLESIEFIPAELKRRL